MLFIERADNWRRVLGMGRVKEDFLVAGLFPILASSCSEEDLDFIPSCFSPPFLHSTYLTTHIMSLRSVHSL